MSLATSETTRVSRGGSNPPTHAAGQHAALASNLAFQPNAPPPPSPNHRADACAVAVVAVVVGGVIYALIKSRPDRYDFKVISHPKVGDVSLGVSVSAFMLLWWAVAVGLLTFWSPFTAISNGYFATWLGFASSAYSLGADRHSTQIVALGPPFGLLASSFVVMFALLPRAFSGTWTRALGLTTSILSIVAMLFVVLVDQKLLKLPLSPVVRSVVFVILAICWLVTSLILTYRGPFTSGLSADGYLGSWAGLAFAILSASQNMSPLNDKLAPKVKVDAKDAETT